MAILVFELHLRTNLQDEYNMNTRIFPSDCLDTLLEVFAHVQLRFDSAVAGA